MIRVFIRAFLAILVVGAALWQPYSAQANSGAPLPEEWSQSDLTSDGMPDLTVWTTRYKSALYRIQVYDGGQDMQASSDWRTALDFSNDIWLFDYLADGSQDLVIQFEQEGENYSAKIWDDQTGDGAVHVDTSNPLPEILESNTPTLLVRSDAAWFTEAGRINGNLKFYYDGVDNTFAVPEVVQHLFPIDGRPDILVEVIDQGNDGVLDYTHRKVLTKVDRDYGVWRENLWVNKGGKVTPLSAEYLYWPLLNFDVSLTTRNFYDTPPMVNVDWTTAKIRSFGIAGYPIESGFSINNFNTWEPGKVNQANFENNMAWYDLAGNQDGFPELFIRHVYWPIHNSWHAPNLSKDTNEIVYSWKQFPTDSLHWDYKLSLAGSNTITDTVNFDDFGLHIVPYQIQPSWVVEREWVNGTFVAVEGRSYISSEGIYEWLTTEGVVKDINDEADNQDIQWVQKSRAVQLKCISGGGDCQIGELYTDIASGLRGEYSNLNGKPVLYISPIDGKLHLKTAEHGTWKISSTESVKYQNLNADDYLDSWQIVRDGEVFSQLYAVDNYLIYAGDNKIAVRTNDLLPAAVEFPPPTNTQEWAEAGNLLQEYQIPSQPGDLEALFRRQGPAQWELLGAELENLRFTPAGFRFTLHLQAGYQVQGAGELNLAGLAPGRYIVKYENGFTIEPSTPPRSSLSFVPLAAKLIAGQPVRMAVQLSNSGLEDFEQLELVVRAVQGDHQVDVARLPVEALAGETQEHSFDWSPTRRGAWRLTAQLEDVEGNLINRIESDFEVAFLPTNVLAVSVSSGAAIPILLLLASFALLLALTFRHIWRGDHNGYHDPVDGIDLHESNPH